MSDGTTVAAPAASSTPATVPTSTPEAAAPQLTREQQFEKAFKDALVEDGVVQPPAGKPAESAPPVAEKAPIAAPSIEKAEPPALLKLAKQASEFRKEKEAVAPYIEALKVLPADRVSGLTRALQSRDPVSALEALGFSAQDVAEKVLKAPPRASAGKSDDEEAPRVPSEILQRLERAEAFAKRFEEQESKSQHAKLVESVTGVVKSNPKFKFLQDTGSYADVLGVIDTYHKQSGSLPADTFEESVLMAAELVEQQLTAQADKWRKLLTPSQTSTTVTPAKPEERAQPGTETRTLTNSNTSAPAEVRPAAQSREERIAALLADPSFQL